MLMNFKNVLEENFAECLSKDVSYCMKRASKNPVVHCFLFTDYLTRELYCWEKTHAGVIIDCQHIAENLRRFSWLEKPYMDTKKLSSLIQISKNNK